jgi:transcriptional regulator GlxA family with amidase domain
MKVAFVISENMLATSLTLPAEMLRAAADLSHARHRTVPLAVHFIARTNGIYNTRCGLPISADRPADDAVYDLIYLPALWRNPQYAVQCNTTLMSWLHKQSDAGALIAAVGTGVCLLAASGLLDDRPATTHWFYLDRFAKLYPPVDLKRQYLITRAGNLYCAASINALADLTVHFIRHFFGSGIAAHVERHFSQEARKPYDNITYREDDSERHHDEDIIQIQLWLHQQYAHPIQLADVARKFGMSVRNFNRRFRAASGKTPLQYLQGLRIDEGSDLLCNSNLSITEVAEKVGYQDSSHFTRLFRDQLKVTPQDYRKSVRRKLFAVDPGQQ